MSSPFKGGNAAREGAESVFVLLGSQPIDTQAQGLLDSLARGMRDIGERAAGFTGDPSAVGRLAGAAIGGAALMDPTRPELKGILADLDGRAKPDHPKGDSGRLEQLMTTLGVETRNAHRGLLWQALEARFLAVEG